MKSEAQFQVRKYSINILEDIKNLWREEYDHDYVKKREILFKWITEQNPVAKNESPYFLLIGDNKVIGMVGHMPLEFTFNGEQERGYLSHDILLAKEFRGMGLGKILRKGIDEQITKFSGAIWFNEPNYHLYQKSGWLNVKEFYPYLKIFDPDIFLNDTFRNRAVLSIVSRVAKLILGIKAIPSIFNQIGLSKGIKILEVKEFNEDVNVFFNNISKYYGIIVARNQKYLNWKFVGKPFNNYKRYIAFDDMGEMSGYLVIKRKISEGKISGKILDMLVHPEKPKVFRALIQKSIIEFTKIGASYVEIVCTFPLIVKELKKYGFIKSKNPQWFMVLNWEKQFQRNFVADIRNWYLTYSDADGDAWEIDSNEPW